MYVSKFRKKKAENEQRLPMSTTTFPLDKPCMFIIACAHAHNLYWY